jgi:hypothetical protein
VTTDDVTRWQELFRPSFRAILAFAWTVPSSTQETMPNTGQLNKSGSTKRDNLSPKAVPLWYNRLETLRSPKNVPDLGASRL